MVMDNSTFDDILNELIDTPVTLQTTDAQLRCDPFATDEQNKRDTFITTLLIAYVKSFKQKACLNIWFRCILFSACLILLTLLLVFLGTTITSILKADQKTVNDLAAIISSCVTFLVALLGILKIITSNVFPQDDEKYITEIVKAIQENDLANKQTYINASQGNLKSD